jgi:acetoin utilization deacetylase AcuC-like enzyme
MKTLIIHHDDCLRHDPGASHPERPERVSAVLSAITGLPGTEFLPAPRATREQVERVHAGAYWTNLVELEPTIDHSNGRIALDPDTWLSPGSVDATLRGSGAACFAIDQLFEDNARNAFCVTRPPGHHAETSTAMGFCLLNHAAVAARHALAAHGASRVAILDFDVHHGNGTQAIFADSPEVLYVSSHQMPLYPGTGAEDERGCGNVLNLPLTWSSFRPDSTRTSEIRWANWSCRTMITAGLRGKSSRSPKKPARAGSCRSWRADMTWTPSPPPRGLTRLPSLPRACVHYLGPRCRRPG